MICGRAAVTINHTPVIVIGFRLLCPGGVAESNWFVAIEGHDLQKKWTDHSNRAKFTVGVVTQDGGGLPV